jgi:hypothetical protein
VKAEPDGQQRRQRVLMFGRGDQHGVQLAPPSRRTAGGSRRKCGSRRYRSRATPRAPASGPHQAGACRGPRPRRAALCRAPGCARRPLAGRSRSAPHAAASLRPARFGCMSSVSFARQQRLALP